MEYLTNTEYIEGDSTFNREIFRTTIDEYYGDNLSMERVWILAITYLLAEFGYDHTEQDIVLSNILYEQFLIEDFLEKNELRIDLKGIVSLDADIVIDNTEISLYEKDSDILLSSIKLAMKYNEDTFDEDIEVCNLTSKDDYYIYMPKKTFSGLKYLGVTANDMCEL